MVRKRNVGRSAPTADFSPRSDANSTVATHILVVAWKVPFPSRSFECHLSGAFVRGTLRPGARVQSLPYMGPSIARPQTARAVPDQRSFAPTPDDPSIASCNHLVPTSSESIKSKNDDKAHSGPLALYANSDFRALRRLQKVTEFSGKTLSCERLVRRPPQRRGGTKLTLHCAHLHQQNFIIACDLNECDWVLLSPRHKGWAPFTVQSDRKGARAGNDASKAFVCDDLRSYVMELSAWGGEHSPVIRREDIRVLWRIHVSSSTGYLVGLQQ
jgi:hypothetical protein